MNAVLHEHVTVFFSQRHGLPALFYPLGLLALIEFLLLTPMFLDAQAWRGAGSLFKLCAAIAVVLTIYFTLRAANLAYAPERFKPLKYWLHERGYPVGVVARGQVSFLLVHAAATLLLIVPLLVWAGAISHTPPAALAATLALIAFYTVCYGVWGLAGLALCEREVDTREMVSRGFTVLLMVIAMLVYFPLNPIVYVLAVASATEPGRFSIAGVDWPPAVANIAFHLAYGAAGLAAHRWALARLR
ncbi:MAG: hypothetical protein FJY56_04770 [Betaproteobacteria bacterium]|nr:hypothetical protein [Betaproteobacteria bacterium]